MHTDYTSNTHTVTWNFDLKVITSSYEAHNSADEINGDRK
jgi:hypothetical protein